MMSLSHLLCSLASFPIEVQQKPAAPDTIKTEFITIKSARKFNGENGFTFEPMLAVNGS